MKSFISDMWRMGTEKVDELSPKQLIILGWGLFVIGHSFVVAVRARSLPWSNLCAYAADGVAILIPALLIIRGTLAVCQERGLFLTVFVLLIETLLGILLWGVILFAVHLGVGGSL